MYRLVSVEEELTCSWLDLKNVELKKFYKRQTSLQISLKTRPEPVCLMNEQTKL